MKLLLRRNQKSGMLGKVTFSLSVRAELTPEEKGDIQKYQLGRTLLYESKSLGNPGDGWAGVGRILLHNMMTLSITVNDLENGKQVDCKDILEMLAAEQQIKEAAQTFNSVLRAASTFGGEELVELA
jgi:hypothetical protein